jgi:hypothetical protein
MKNTDPFVQYILRFMCEHRIQISGKVFKNGRVDFTSNTQPTSA